MGASKPGLIKVIALLAEDLTNTEGRMGEGEELSNVLGGFIEYKYNSMKRLPRIVKITLDKQEQRWRCS